MERRVFISALGAACLRLGALKAGERKGRRTLLVGCRDHHLRGKDVKDTWEAARAVGAEGIEVWVEISRACPYLLLSGRRVQLKGKRDLKALKERSGETSVMITAFCLPNRFDKRPREELKWLIETIHYAAELEVPAVRIDVVPTRLAGKEKEFLDLASRLINQALQATSGLKVCLGVENHGRFTNRPEILSALFARIPSPRFGLTLDTANFYWYGFALPKLYQIYERFAPKVCHTHMKSIDYPKEKERVRRPIGWEYGKWCCPIHKGDIDMERVCRILKKAGYKNDLCVEDESLGKFPEEKRFEVLAEEIQLLKNIRGKIWRSSRSNRKAKE